MTADDFLAWIDHMGWYNVRAAKELGVSRNTITRYAKEGAPVHIALACSALAFGLPRWSLNQKGQPC